MRSVRHRLEEESPRLTAAILGQISTFLNDYANALARAKAFDAQVKSDATKISTDYASVVALSIRQAFGATEITVSKNSDGSFDASNTLMFMKGAHIVVQTLGIVLTVFLA